MFGEFYVVRNLDGQLIIRTGDFEKLLDLDPEYKLVTYDQFGIDYIGIIAHFLENVI